MMKLLRIKQVEKRVGISGTQIRRLERAGQFPVRAEISERSFGYAEDEVDLWIQERLAAREHRAA